MSTNINETIVCSNLQAIRIFNVLYKSNSDRSTLKTSDRRYEVVKNILKNGGIDVINMKINASTETRVYEDQNLCEIAAVECDFQAIKIFLKHGAKVSYDNDQEHTIIHKLFYNYYRKSTCWYLQNTDLRAIVKSFLSNHKIANDASNPTCENGISNFHIACAMDDVDVVDFFLKAGVSIDEAIHVDSPVLPGYTALHVAVAHSNPSIVQLLLKHGADLILKEATGMTALNLLIKNNVELAEDLKAVTDESEMIKLKRKLLKINQGITVLLMKAMEMHMPDYVDEFGLTKLHVACTLPFEDASYYVYQGFNMYTKVKSDSPFCRDFTPMHFASRFDLTTTVELLFNHPTMETEDCERWRRFTESMPYRSIDLFDLVLASKNMDDLYNYILSIQKDMNVAVPTDSLSPYSGCEILHLLIIMMADKKKSKDQNYIVADYINIIKNCFILGANIHAKNVSGSTPIHYAFEFNENVVLDLLLTHSDRIEESPKNMINSDNLSYLYIAIIIRNDSLTRYLLNLSKNNKGIVKELNIALSKEYSFDNITLSVGSTPLHAAVLRGNKKIVKILLNLGADPYAEDSENLSPLHLAMSRYAPADISEVILQKVNIENPVCMSFDLTLLHVAARANNLNAVKSLLDRGADINKKIVCEIEGVLFEDLKSMSGFTPLRCAIEGYSKDAIDYLIMHGADVEDALNIFSGNWLSTKYFIEALLKYYYFDNVQNFVHETGFNQLHLACLSPYVDQETIIPIISKSNVNQQTRNSNHAAWSGLTPLHILIKKYISTANFKEITEQMFPIFYLADVTIFDSMKFTPVHQLHWHALRHKSYVYYTKLIDLILSGQQDFSKNPIDRYGLSHFHIAICVNNSTLVRKFLSYGNDIDRHIDFSAPFNAGYKPLHFAANNNCNEVARILLECQFGLDFVRAEDVNGDTPLHVALRMKQIDLDIVSRLLSAGADVNAKNILDETPLEVLLGSQEPSVNIKCFEILVNHGCRVNIYNNITSNRLLTMLVNYEESDDVPVETIALFKVMLNAQEHCDEFDLTELDIDGRNVIHNLVSVYHRYGGFPYEEIIKSLCEIGCYINERDKKGMTPLHYAVMMKSRFAVEALLSNGADVNSIDSMDKLPLDYCEGHDSCEILDIIKFFRDHSDLLLYMGLHVCKRNQKIIYKSNISNASVLRLRSKYSASCTPELEKLLQSPIRPGGNSSMRDFLFNSRVMVKYVLWWQDGIDDFFQSKEKLCPTLHGVLMTQYQKAIRLRLTIEILRTACPKIPELCLEIILNHLHKL